MDEPKKILKFNDGVMIPRNDSKTYIYLKRAIMILLGILVVSCIIFRKEYYEELSSATLICFVMLVALMLVFGLYSRSPVPIEVIFYEDYFTVDWPFTWCGRPQQFRREFFKMYYKDVERCFFRQSLDKMTFYGTIEATFIDYNKDGTKVAKEPKVRTANSLVYFYMVFAPEIDIIKEIEENTPLKVEIQEY